MCHVFLCPLTICNLTEMWDKERDISIQFLDLMETDFIEIFRVKTWLLVVAISRLGWGWIAAYKLQNCSMWSPPAPAPDCLCPAPARSFQYCAQLTRSQHEGKYTQTQTEIQIFKLSTITMTDLKICIDFLKDHGFFDSLYDDLLFPFKDSHTDKRVCSNSSLNACCCHSLAALV